LAMFDALYAPATPVKIAQAPALTPAAPVAPPATPTEETKPAETTAAQADTAPAAGSATEPATPAAAADGAAPTVVAKAAPEQTSSPGAPPLVPLPPEKPLTKPATGRQAMIRPSEPMLPMAPPAATRPDPQREIARAPLGGQHNAPASRPLTQSIQSSNRQFALQLGVFNNLANAEELRAKLELQGIPSTIEARVQVGPFKTREEIESARQKLRALGMDPGIMISLRK
jgi:cell division protein FtsN